jgi:drug/metabolite transporter (DMT)-like permease
MRDDGLVRTFSMSQGLFYALTGFWPLISRRTFEKVTGPKHDFWLVNTVGVVIGTIGLMLISAGYNGRVTPEIRGLAAGTAAGLTGIDLYYVKKKRIPRIYLLDALGEISLILGWIFLQKKGE